MGTEVIDDFTTLAALLNLNPNETVSVGSKPIKGRFHGARVRVADLNGTPTDRDHWTCLNPINPHGSGRGGASDVTRVAAIWADLDIKPGGLPDMETCRAVIATLSIAVGTTPTAVTESGHGLQPIWATEDGDLDTWGPLCTRWGALVKKIAASHGGDADPVFDLSRVLRTPGGVNHKARAVGVVCRATGGRPLAAREVADACDTYNIGEAHTAPPSAPTGIGALPATPTPAAPAAPRDATPCPYVTEMLTGWDNDQPPARHPWLLSQATRLAAAIAHGCLTAAEAREAVTRLAARMTWLCANTNTRRETDPSEIPDALTWGRNKIAAMGPEQIAGELGGHTHTPPVADYFGDTALLAWCRDHARTRVISPAALLGATLARVSAETSPRLRVALPTGPVALNLYALLVGPSGSGKSRAMSELEAAWCWQAQTIHPSTGEGIIDTYTRTIKGEVVQRTDRAFGIIDEIETIRRIAQREGSTIMSVLRSIWNGSPAGMTNRTEKGGVRAGKARLGLVVGVQPRLAGWLFDDAVAGTLQRFLWFPATDMTRPPTTPAVSAGVMPLRLPTASDIGDMSCEGSIAEAIAAETLARTTSDWASLDDDHDSHGSIQALRIAGLLAAAEGRTHVSEADYRTAKAIKADSDNTRDRCAAIIAVDNNRKRENATKALAERSIAVRRHEETETEKDILRVAGRIVSIVAGSAPSSVKGGEITVKLTIKERKVKDAALELAQTEGWIKASPVSYHGQEGWEYTLGEVAKCEG